LYTPLEPPSALPGYLGSTSFTAVLAEHRNEIPLEPEESTDAYPAVSVDPDRVQSGAEVLLLLYNLDIRRQLIDRYYRSSWGAIVPKMMMDAILESIAEIFDGFNPNDPKPQLQDFSARIFQNSTRALKTHQSMTVQEYCNSFTGSNFRWEALGNILTICGQQLVITPDNDPEFSQETDDPGAKDRLLEQVTITSSVCLGFCDQASSANELLAFLQYTDVMLRTQQYGDSSMICFHNRTSNVSLTVDSRLPSMAPIG
jgi:hypothetical protein